MSKPATPAMTCTASSLHDRQCGADIHCIAAASLSHIISNVCQCLPSLILALQYHNEKCNLDLADLLQQQQASWQKIRTMQRVREGVKLRLEMNIPYIGMLQRLHTIVGQTL